MSTMYISFYFSIPSILSAAYAAEHQPQNELLLYFQLSAAYAAEHLKIVVITSYLILSAAYAAEHKK
ncbi:MULTISPECIES: hypothetical protein [unclassified Colwellia]|uniref:hypothetical protein n=1 Tax=unclassified Colwellia TaxID=196834 RepID=UPI001C084639|nr:MULTISPECIES: hypothetical protein [unclassified Colwellia]MBU2925249.1 hypothetical protein [Colwellia sp. C2M11]MDO6664351.1 hypothetical protein [Colwellia sp. 2_MG-2023]